MDWGKWPDIVAIALLACAFASVARQSRVRSSNHWLTGWLLIMLHFAALLFEPAPGIWGNFALLIGLGSLAAAGIVFMWAVIPYHEERSSRWMLAVLLSANFLMITGLVYPRLNWLIKPVALLYALGPLGVTLGRIRQFHHPLRWLTVILNSSLAVFLLVGPYRHLASDDSAMNAILFTIYFSTALHFWYACRSTTAGTFITVSGFFGWASVFMISPLLESWFPHAHVESEVWNLPKYVVAVGMILLQLENQIEYNKHLALHDDLTGLPNRRLFHDRLTSALERARRSKTQAALLVLDLDHFKNVNDSLGHHVGDLLLRYVAGIFTARIRRSDTVARTGGDEFSVILEEPTNDSVAAQVAHALLEKLKEPIQLEGRVVRVGASVGVAIFPDDALDMQGLCVVADLRMYDNKRAGRSAADLIQPVNPLAQTQSPISTEKRGMKLRG